MFAGRLAKNIYIMSTKSFFLTYVSLPFDVKKKGMDTALRPEGSNV